MRKSTVDFLSCPVCSGDLKSEENSGPEGKMTYQFHCASCGVNYGSGEGYPDFLGEKGLEYSGSRERIVRSVYAKVYKPVTNFMYLFCGGTKSARNEVLSNLDLKDGSTVLETGMGYGDNFLWMSEKAKNLRFFGVDIQKQMMLSCMHNLSRWKISAEIVRADAQNLPFRNEVFDVVFHLGAINLFPDKGKAIGEMIRVAKPGTRIVIADETEKAGKLFRIFTGSNERNDPPLEFVPDTMLDVSLKIIWRGYGYLITFTKPGQ